MKRPSCVMSSVHIVLRAIRVALYTAVAGTVALAIPATADDPEEVTATTDGKLELSETDYDFGYMQQRVQVSHRYWMKNVGGQEVRIEDVQPGCGCTRAPLQKKNIPAGDSSFVDLIFASGHFDGHVHKSARVICNVPGRAPELFFDAYPLKFPDTLGVYTVSPAELQLDELRADDDTAVWNQTISVKNVSSETLRFRFAQDPDISGVRVTLPRRGIAPGEVAAIRVALEGDIAEQILTKSFTIEASDSARTRFTVAVRKPLRWGPLPRADH